MIYFKKSQPAPACLDTEKNKKSGDYKCGDVLTRLRTDFCNKCYLCEQKEPTGINIEHFVPHRGDIDLRFDWSNLFLACTHCNNTKLAKPEFDDILNCIIQIDDVDTAIKYEIKPYPSEKAVFTLMINNQKVVNTKTLLEAIYNGEHTEVKKIESNNLRAKLIREIRIFQGLLFEYIEMESDEEERNRIGTKIKNQLHKSSPFTAFKRWIIRDNAVLNDYFGAYCQ